MRLAKTAPRAVCEEGALVSDKPKMPAKRGFAAMSKEKRSAISRLGGAAVPNEKRAFTVNSALAASAGQKGGERAQGRRSRRDQ